MDENKLYQTALSRAMALCSQREHCIDDIMSKLHSWGVGESDCSKITTHLVRENFINEERYAKAFASDRFRYNRWGRIKIRAGLKMKKIPGTCIDTALGSLDNDLYKKTVKELLAAHRKSVKAKNQYDLKGKLLRFGLSRGFESEILYDLLSEIES